ncbi:MAG TPA: FmdB family zinc ribbon protein [Acidimicrobiales bacterium]|nr:FmdB family zinc ribbon protein [Acidimicrobiales bacterium]
MPTYEYACRTCGEHLEVVQSFKDEPLTECPACHGALRKVFSPIGISFKGSGFYKTDSRPSSKGGTSKTDAASATSGSGSSEAGGSGAAASSGGDSSTSPTSPTSSTAAAAS